MAADPIKERKSNYEMSGVTTTLSPIQPTDSQSSLSQLFSPFLTIFPSPSSSSSLPSLASPPKASNWQINGNEEVSLLSSSPLSNYTARFSPSLSPSLSFSLLLSLSLSPAKSIFKFFFSGPFPSEEIHSINNGYVDIGSVNVEEGDVISVCASLHALMMIFKFDGVVTFSDQVNYVCIH
jgi:hypothetical protein